jgi:hypothetical protein
MTSYQGGLSFDNTGALRVTSSSSDISIDVRSYGALVNGATNDATAIQNALTAAGTYVTSGVAAYARVIIPPGIAAVSSKLNVPNRVILCGAGSARSAVIKALAGFPTSTAMIDLNDYIYSSGFVFGARVQGLVLDANNIAGSTCLTSAQVQEGSGYYDCVFQNYRDTGVAYTGSGQNVIANQGEFYPSASGSNYGLNPSSGILLNATGNTFVATAGTHPVAFNWNCSAVISGVHVEGHTTGVLCKGTGSLHGVTGPTGAYAVTNLVYNDASASRYFFVSGLVKNAATNILKDDFTGKTYTDAYLTSYSALPQISAGYEKEPNPFSYAATVTLDASRYEHNYMSNSITGAMTMAAPTGAQRGRKLTIELLQDGTGGRNVTWNAVFKGVTLAASGTANQKAIITFECDGTDWYQQGSSGWQS